jgi:CHAD domain protein
MRVATRELRSHLQSFASILAGTHHKDVSEELKHLAATLGVARDAEVIAERFKDLCDQHPSGIIDAASGKQLHDDMLAEYAAAHQKVVAALNDDRYLRLLDELDELIAHPQELADPDPTPASTHVLLEQLRKSYKRLMKLHNKAMSDWDGRSSLRPQQEQKFHNVRKAAKKLRYTTEAVGDATDIPTGQLYRACKQLQEVLGNFQDSITSRKKLLAKSHEAFKRGENTFIYGVLYETEVELSRNIMQDYPAAMAAVTQAYQRL